MSTFSDVLTEYINTKNIKVFPMAKYCGLDRSTMYKLISDQWQAQPASQRYFEKNDPVHASDPDRGPTS